MQIQNKPSALTPGTANEIISEEVAGDSTPSKPVAAADAATSADVAAAATAEEEEAAAAAAEKRRLEQRERTERERAALAADCASRCPTKSGVVQYLFLSHFVGFVS